MKITQSDRPSRQFEERFHVFCRESKPYDFCSVGSPALRKIKITEYLRVLEGCVFVEAWDDEIFRAGAVFNLKKNIAILEFAFGNRLSPHSLAEGWQKILDYSFKTWRIKRVESVIQRKKNIRALIRWIERNDPRAIIKGKEIVWFNDRQG